LDREEKEGGRLKEHRRQTDWRQRGEKGKSGVEMQNLQHWDGTTSLDQVNREKRSFQANERPALSLVKKEKKKGHAD